MMTSEAFGEFAASLPEAEVREHWGKPSYRVRNRIFATLEPDEGRCVIKASLGEQEMLVQSDPETFTIGNWGHQGWTHVRLDRANPDQLEELLVSAWARLAPKRALKAYEASLGE